MSAETLKYKLHDWTEDTGGKTMNTEEHTRKSIWIVENIEAILAAGL